MGHSKGADGFYHIKGHKYEILCGSRAQVMHGTAYKTTGGLTKSDLVQNKHGRIVSKKKHHHEKKSKRLQKHGYTAKKGKFGAVRMSRMSKRRGGTSSVSNNSMSVPLVSTSAMNAINPTNKMIVSGGYNAPSAAYSNFGYEQRIPGAYGAGTGVVTPQERANWAAAGGSRTKRRGGFVNNTLSPASANSNSQISSPGGLFSNSRYTAFEAGNPATAALMAGAGYKNKKGGYKNKDGRRTVRPVRRGGSLTMTPLNEAYQGLSEYIVPQSFTPQMNALMAGA